MAKERTVRVKHIGIEIGGQEHELSLEEARALRDALSDLLGKETITIRPAPNPCPFPVPQPYPIPYPVPVWPRPRPWSPYWDTKTAPGTDTVWLSKASETTGGRCLSS